MKSLGCKKVLVAIICYLILSFNSKAQSNFKDVFAFNGNGRSEAMSIDVNGKGGKVIAGHFADTLDVNPRLGVKEIYSNGGNDIFVCKTDINDSLIWSLSFGSKKNDILRTIKVDDSSNVYVTGYFEDTVDFDPSTKVYSVVANFTDGFVAKYDSLGQFLWVKVFDGVLYDLALNAGGFMISGRVEYRGDLAPGNGAFIVSNRFSSAFIGAYNSAGHFKSALVFATGTAFGAAINPACINMSDSGHVFVGGWFSGDVDFDPGTGLDEKEALGFHDMFIAKYNYNSKSLIWAKAFGTKQFEYVISIDNDKDGNLIAGGIFNEKMDFDPAKGAKVLEPKIGRTRRYDGFLMSLSDFGKLNWAQRFGNENDDNVYDIINDKQGNLFVAGSITNKVDFDASKDSLIINGTSNSNAFLAKYSDKGKVRWVKHFKSEKYGRSRAVNINSKGNIFVAGSFSDTTDFNLGSSSKKLVSKNDLDPFVSTFKGCKNVFSSFKASSCGSYSSPSGKYEWRKSGVYKDTVLSRGGCDSVITVSLRILKSDTILYFTICDSLAWSPKKVFKQSGVYIDTLINKDKCDSIITLNVTVNRSNEKTETVSVCDSYTWANKNKGFANSGLYYDSLLTKSGCDSVIILDLDVRKSSFMNLSVKACDSFYWPQTKSFYLKSALVLDTIKNVAGCDSVVALNLSINDTKRFVQSEKSCNSYTWSQTSKMYSQSGTYTDTLKTLSGCDSIIYLNLIIFKSDSIYNSISACDSFFWPIDSTWKMSTGLYKMTFVNKHGCDSTQYLDLVLGKTVYTKTAMKACDSFIWKTTGKTYSNSGTYLDTVTTSNGCLSISELELTVNKKTVLVDSVFTCDGFWHDNKMSWLDKSGIYLDTQITQNGCDSINVLVLTIEDALDTSYTINQGVITFSDSSKNYRWFTCANELVEISGANKHYFKPMATGSYAAEISGTTCVDTISCKKITVTGVYRPEISLVLWPNPSSNKLNFRSNVHFSNAEFSIHDCWGRKIDFGKINDENQSIDVSSLASGTYKLCIAADGYFASKTFVKE